MPQASLSIRPGGTFFPREPFCMLVPSTSRPAGAENALKSASQSFFPNFRHPDLMMQVQKEGVKMSEASVSHIHARMHAHLCTVGMDQSLCKERHAWLP